MMAVETGQAVTTAIWTRLTTDGTLQAALGGSVSLYRVMAPQDPAMPYLVHRMSFRGAFHDTHTYLLDVWDYAETPTRVDSAIERIRQLLHEWRFTTAASEASGLLSWFSGGYIPTDAEQVWHYAMQYDVRLVAGQDITAIVT